MFWCQKKGQLVPNIGKHRAKQELESVPPQELGKVPPQELGTVPPQGSKNGLWGGTVSNYPVGLFLALDLLLAAVRMIFFLRWYCSWLLKRQKSGTKTDSGIYVCVCIYIYIYMCVCVCVCVSVPPSLSDAGGLSAIGEMAKTKAAKSTFARSVIDKHAQLIFGLCRRSCF